MATQRLPHQAQIAILARFYARNYAKAAMKEQGIRVQEVEAREITLAAEALLQERWDDFVSEAEALFTKIESDAQKRKRAKSKASAVQNSGAKVEGRS